MRILHVDACGLTTGQARLVVEREGIIYEETDSAEDGLDQAAIYEYDVIVTETQLPDRTGLWMIRKMRERKISTPVIVLSGHHEVETRIEYLRVGADDYMTKPHHPAELVVRVQALARRSRGQASPTITIGPLVVDMDQKTATVSGRKMHMTGREYSLLELLASRPGATITKEVLMNHLYGGRDEPEMKIIDVFVCKLRKKMAQLDPASKFLIETVWGRGYTIRPQA